MHKVPFYDEGYVYQTSEISAYVIDKQSGICRR